jgi:hypothetical protein
MILYSSASSGLIHIISDKVNVWVGSGVTKISEEDKVFMAAIIMRSL